MNCRSEKIEIDNTMIPCLSVDPFIATPKIIPDSLLWNWKIEALSTIYTLFHGFSNLLHSELYEIKYFFLI